MRRVCPLGWLPVCRFERQSRRVTSWVVGSRLGRGAGGTAGKFAVGDFLVVFGKEGFQRDGWGLGGVAGEVEVIIGRGLEFLFPSSRCTAALGRLEEQEPSWKLTSMRCPSGE